MVVKPCYRVVLIVRLAIFTVINTFRVVIVALFFDRNPDRARKVVLSWARKFLGILKVNYQVINQHNLEFDHARPYMIMSNHASHFDIPLIYASFPNEQIGMISKKELFRIPVFGLGMKVSGCVSIDRENKRQAVKDLAVAKASMLGGLRIWVAPEGTRSRTGKLGAFKRGGFKLALDAKAIIVPVTIVGSNKILPAQTYDLSTNETVEIYIGRPLDTREYQADGLRRLMADTAKEIEGNLPESLRG